MAMVSKYIGGLSAADALLDSGSLHLLPANVQSTRAADGFAFGAGRGLVSVWQLTFRRDGVIGTWRARVNASTGALLELADVNDYTSAQVTGGVYQSSPANGPEIVRPMPYVGAGGSSTNSAGYYNFTSATSSTLDGLFVIITDSCGSISQASNGTGAIAFGTSGGTDCTTPGHGGLGNTHASRQQYYQVNRIKEVGRGWLPANAWLSQKLNVNVNLSGTCNANWDGTSLNFYEVTGTCGNTGEIAGVSLHEYGHGLDQNDGSGPETGTGESYADVTSTIALHDSCMGPGFLGTNNCLGYGDACTSCTGVRELDYAKHSSGTPATVANFTQAHCLFGGGGPCGGEVHCESYVSSEAIWDFANRDLPTPGTSAAWTILDRLWYLSRGTSTSGFTCHTGATYTSDGCGTGNWWKTMRAVDDDDGNLSNGTPHGGALYAAFNRHGIACTTDPGASTTFAGCTPPTKPTLTATAGSNSVSLSWSTSGSVLYDLYRNETGCNGSFTQILPTTTSTSFTDTGVANGLTYYYQVTAFPAANAACASVPSTCVSVTPVPPPAPVADFSFTCSGLACSFDGTASTGPSLTYAWTYGDSGTGTGSTPSHTYSATGVYTVTLTVTDSLARTSSKSRSVSVTSDPVAAAENYFAVAPCRILDTRTTTILSNNVPRILTVAGSCGIPSTATAVSFNATVVSPTGNGKITLYPGNLSVGASATINFVSATSPRGNDAIIQLATDGSGTLGINAGVSGSPGQAHVVLDVQGYFSTDTTPASGAVGPLGFQTLPICRLLDTRSSSQLSAGVPRTFTVQGACSVPSGAAAGSFHVGVIAPAAGGFFTLYSSSISTPTVSAINFLSGISALRNGARLNLASSTPDAAIVFGGTTGTSVDATVDVNGYFKSTAPLKYHPITPCRALDTTDANNGGPALVADAVRNFQIQGNCGVPVGAKAVAVRLKIANPTSTGVMSVYPSNVALPPNSTIQFDSGEPALSMGTIVALSTLANDLAVSPNKMTTGATVDLLIDVFGYFN